VRDTAASAVETARSIAELFQGNRDHIRHIGRGSGSALQVHEALAERPLATVGSLVEATALSAPTAGRALESLEVLGIVREITGRRRSRVYAYSQYLDMLNRGMEPL
jgi:Fic family protein